MTKNSKKNNKFVNRIGTVKIFTEKTVVAGNAARRILGIEGMLTLQDARQIIGYLGDKGPTVTLVEFQEINGSMVKGTQIGKSKSNVPYLVIGHTVVEDRFQNSVRYIQAAVDRASDMLAEAAKNPWEGAEIVTIEPVSF